MKKSIASVFKFIASQESREMVVEALRQNDHPVIKQLIYYAYSPSVKFLLPEGAPPYKPCEFVDQEGRLMAEVRKMYLFIEGGNPNLTAMKREMLFIQLIESIAPDDAELLIAIKDKTLPHQNITPDVVREAFPDLLPPEEAPKNEKKSSKKA